MEWQPIETAPTNGTYVWVGAPGVRRIGFYGDERWHDMVSLAGGGRAEAIPFTPTHWMPLPAPPPAVES